MLLGLLLLDAPHPLFWLTFRGIPQGLQPKLSQWPLLFPCCARDLQGYFAWSLLDNFECGWEGCCWQPLQGGQAMCGC